MPKFQKRQILERAPEGPIPVDEVFDAMAALERMDKTLEVRGYTVKRSQRYTLFKQKGVRCVSCGLEATHFVLERHPSQCHQSSGRYHMNLYSGEYGSDDEVLFTKDHIIPKSKGGRDTISNYDVMCSPCNNSKGNGS